MKSATCVTVTATPMGHIKCVKIDSRSDFVQALHRAAAARHAGCLASTKVFRNTMQFESAYSLEQTLGAFGNGDRRWGNPSPLSQAIATVQGYGLLLELPFLCSLANIPVAGWSTHGKTLQRARSFSRGCRKGSNNYWSLNWCSSWPLVCVSAVFTTF